MFRFSVAPYPWPVLEYGRTAQVTQAAQRVSPHRYTRQYGLHCLLVCAYPRCLVYSLGELARETDLLVHPTIDSGYVVLFQIVLVTTCLAHTLYIGRPSTGTQERTVRTAEVHLVTGA